MPAINLKDFFCRYTTDKFIDVSEKGPEELRTDKRYEATQSIRITYASIVKLEGPCPLTG